MNEYLRHRFGQPCRECGYQWSLPFGAAALIIDDGASRIRDLLEAREGTERHPGLEWSARAYVSHLADTVHIWAARLAAAAQGAPNPVVPFDERELGSVRGYDGLAGEGALWSLDRAVGDWHAAQAEALGKGIVLRHPEQGLLQSDDVARILAHEVHHHGQDIARIVTFHREATDRDGQGPGERSRPRLVTVEPADPRSAEVQAVIRRHLAFCVALTPPANVCALDYTGLLDPAITMFGARMDGRLAGIGAIRDLGDGHAELKSMHTLEAFRGQGLGKAMVDHLLTVATERGCRRVSLETGSMAAFEPARRLYARVGFVPSPPFGSYKASQYTTFMTLFKGPGGEGAV